ncbi:MAG: hypothetical protein AAF696_15540 [Bacteroidota bacterium]
MLSIAGIPFSSTYISPKNEYLLWIKIKKHKYSIKANLSELKDESIRINVLKSARVKFESEMEIQVIDIKYLEVRAKNTISNYAVASGGILDAAFSPDDDFFQRHLILRLGLIFGGIGTLLGAVFGGSRKKYSLDGKLEKYHLYR